MDKLTAYSYSSNLKKTITNWQVLVKYTMISFHFCFALMCSSTQQRQIFLELFSCLQCSITVYQKQHVEYDCQLYNQQTTYL